MWYNESRTCYKGLVSWDAPPDKRKSVALGHIPKECNMCQNATVFLLSGGATMVQILLLMFTVLLFSSFTMSFFVDAGLDFWSSSLQIVISLRNLYTFPLYFIVSICLNIYRYLWKNSL